MINIVIPMAGAGSRFANAGYIDPKPLIEINGIPMIRLVINNLKPSEEHRFIFICQKEHLKRYQLAYYLEEWAPQCKIIEIDGLTEGAACTVLKAREFIDNLDHLMIANSDQYVDIQIDDYLNHDANRNLDGLIMTMKAYDSKWSFVGLKDNLVTKVVEKEVISDEATVGIYNFYRGKDFVKAADEMIEKNLRVNNEFYVAPTYNELINKGKKYGIYNIGSIGKGMHGLGTPDDLKEFLTTEVCKKITLA
jgi:dTDP-glucose pyrophosphorylase